MDLFSMISDGNDHVCAAFMFESFICDKLIINYLCLSNLCFYRWLNPGSSPGL